MPKPLTPPAHRGQQCRRRAAACEQAAPQCPQMVDPGIDFLSHVLLQRLRGRGCLMTGIRQSVVALLQAARPTVLLVTTETGSNSAVLANLATVSCMLGVPVVYTLSRRHMGEACGAPCGISAVAIMDEAPEDTDMILTAILERAAKAWREFSDKTPSLHPVDALTPASFEKDDGASGRAEPEGVEC